MDNLNLIAEERLLKATDIARILGISRALAYRLLQQREIPVIKFNRTVRVRSADLQDFIEKCRQEK